ncbi:multifunctional CCA addition/repair protein [Gilvimarinus sp. F26214L]|uniref:multifunctional CCA addition/repair protein n=1 Tax=Gilvimarinus sp. DZF01 TaxID=3461371 RepID=UPI004046481A
MQVYLVGGAVRDRLMNYPCHEQDWVVVGARPEELQSLGYLPVGKDFPVFLHPETKEEYALARTERKTGRGYTGFEFHAAPDVTLEQDLARRDLTINALAMDDEGNIIDPYGGQWDLQAKLLRHVSDNFREDPVRILRVARFAARYHNRGFRIADTTLKLMREMVDCGEVDYLVPERVWKEMSRALAEANPEVFFEVLRQCGALQRLLPEIANLYGVPQPPRHHPEIDCGVHTVMALQQAAKLSPSTTVRFATLVHDLGKATTPADVLPSHYGHEERGVALINGLCDRLAVPNAHRQLAVMVSRYHTHCHRVKELKASTLLRTLEALDAFRRPDRFAEFLLCCEADARGRTGFENRDYSQVDYFRKALELCERVTSAQVDPSVYKGKAFGEELQRLRRAALKPLRDEALSARRSPDHSGPQNG